MAPNSHPLVTMFERFVVFQQPHLEIGRRYIQAFGLAKGVNAIVEDMNEGRLPWDKAQKVLAQMHYLFIESIVRRVGFERFSDVLKEPEYLAMQAQSVASEQQRHGPFPEDRYARAIESFAWNSLRHWHFVAQDLGGRHIYEITPRLAQVLRRPPPLEEPWRRPRLPVPSLLLIVPEEAKLTITLKGFTSREVTEIYVVESSPPQHQWAVWIHAPIDDSLSESVYLELPFSAEGTLEEGLDRAHDMFQKDSPSIDGWKECVRWLAAAMRYLDQGGARMEFQPGESDPSRRVLIGDSEAIQ
ncbi:hypothetical protein [Hyalangium minutum]|uniref:Uncharacterized protein n=1 Tax=Hyalangium minutum TaxID=394096 RepID=A0A085WU39_9BACT|nr:hypothetical protein [Hyalangium minutum]KFE71202.1 hypothetical protein DB31_3332 [Hyalangium minutum]